MKRHTAIVCALVLVAGLAGVIRDAAAYRMIQNTTVGRVSAGAAVTCSNSGGFTHWNTCNISWRLNTANQGSGKTTAVQNAMASWTGVANACHNLTYAGTTTAGFVTDGINTLRWATGEGCSGSCLALTALVLASGQVITETDVTFNNAVTWTTNGANYDTEAVTAHELGHTLGIHHTQLGGNPRPTMYAYYFGSAGRSLETDDRSALQCAQNRYPPPGSASSAAVAGDGLAGDSAPIAMASGLRRGGALLRYRLDHDADVVLQIFDVAGRRLATLAEGLREAGEHEVHWDGSTPGGRAAPGVYFARLVAGDMKARATVVLRD